MSVRFSYRPLKSGLSNPRPACGPASTAMNAARNKIINFLKTMRFLCTYWKTYQIQSDIFFF